MPKIARKPPAGKGKHAPRYKRKPLQIETPRKPGRPEEYTQAIADEICARIASGRALASVVQDADMPADTTVYRWRVAHPEFSVALARAREHLFERVGEQMIGLGTNVQKSDGPDPARVRAAVDAFDKAGRLMQDKHRFVQVSGPGGRPIETVDFTGWSPDRIKKYREQLAALAALVTPTA